VIIFSSLSHRIDRSRCQLDLKIPLGKSIGVNANRLSVVCSNYQRPVIDANIQLAIETPGESTPILQIILRESVAKEVLKQHRVFPV
jgi:hypothetical protein